MRNEPVWLNESAIGENFRSEGSHRAFYRSTGSKPVLINSQVVNIDRKCTGSRIILNVQVRQRTG